MKRSITIFLSLILAATMLLTACSESKPGTLEEIVETDEEVAEEINRGAEESGIGIEIKGNEITYTYDISSVDGVTDEMIEDEDFVKSFSTSLESQGAAFADICASLEEKTGIEGVSVTVVYMYGDKKITSATYTSADAASSKDSDTDSDEASGVA